MAENLLDPLTLFFLLGLMAGIVRTDLRLPEAIYQVLSVYLLLAIGLKGGVQLAGASGAGLILPVLGAMFLGSVLPLVAYVILRRLGRFKAADAAAIAAHYGSVSAVTFAVVLGYLDRVGAPYEGFMSVLLVVLEMPAIAVGILIARLRAAPGRVVYPMLLHEVFLNRGVYLLMGGLLVGLAAGPARLEPLDLVFVDAFRGALAFFLLEMGVVTSQRLGDLRQVGLFLIGFGVGMPLLSGALGAAVGVATGLSVGGVAVLATMAASASYIAAPAAMRLAVPEANPTYYFTASLGVTFPFNLTLGIPIYHWMARVASGM